MSYDQEMRDRLNPRYIEEGWGKIASEALGIEPFDVERWPALVEASRRRICSMPSVNGASDE